MFNISSNLDQIKNVSKKQSYSVRNIKDQDFIILKKFK